MLMIYILYFTMPSCVCGLFDDHYLLKHIIYCGHSIYVMNDTNNKFNILSLTMWNADGVAMRACNDYAQQPHPFFG